MTWILVVEVPLVLVACVWLVVVGQVLARQRDQEFQAAHLALLGETVEKTALAFRSALGFNPPDSEPVKVPELFGPVPSGWVPPDSEVNDTWADDGPQLLKQDDGSFVGWGEVGLPVPPGETGL